jgi:hypothetical protein
MQAQPGRAVMAGVLLSVFIHSSTAATTPRTHLPQIRQQRQEAGSTAAPPRSDSPPSIADCTWKFYPQPLSHFNEGHTQHGNATFLQRVCLVDRYWRAPSADMLAGGGTADTGPILFCEYANSPFCYCVRPCSVID